MKEPRLEDFDPKSRKFTLEELDVSGFVPIRDKKQTEHQPAENRTTGDAVVFEAEQSKKTQDEDFVNDAESERISERKTVRNSERTENRTLSLPEKRRATRYSFEFYEDQIVKIKRLKYEAEQAGQKVSLSDIARQALDEYLADK